MGQVHNVVHRERHLTFVELPSQPWCRPGLPRPRSPIPRPHGGMVDGYAFMLRAPSASRSFNHRPLWLTKTKINTRRRLYGRSDLESLEILPSDDLALPLWCLLEAADPYVECWQCSLGIDSDTWQDVRVIRMFTAYLSLAASHGGFEPHFSSHRPFPRTAGPSISIRIGEMPNRLLQQVLEIIAVLR